MAMSDGVTSLLAMSVSQYFGGGLVPKPGADFLNGGLPCYNVFECSDGKWLSIGSLEPWFWKETCEQLGLEEYIPHQNNREKFPEMFETMRRTLQGKDPRRVVRAAATARHLRRPGLLAGRGARGPARARRARW